MALPETFPDFQFVNVFRPGPGIQAIRWALQPTSWDYADLSFLVFRSQSPTGPWDELAEIEPGRWQFHDQSAPGINRNFYYLIRIVSRNGRGYRDSRAARLEHDPDHIALEMVRKKNLFLQNRGGITCAALLRKTWGPHCSRCWNPERQTPTDKDCPECFGTGYAGGYMNPVEMPCLFNPPEKAILRAGMPHELGQTYCELANYPNLDSDDIIVDRYMNIRYQVVHVRPTTHRMYPVSQLVRLLRVDDADIIYSLEVPDTLHGPYGRSFDMLNREEDRHEIARP
jgi:hypothetical protein